MTTPKLGDSAVRAKKLGPIAIRTETETVKGKGPVSVEVSCHDGERMLSGGGGFLDEVSGSPVLLSSTNLDDDTWQVRGYITPEKNWQAI